MYSPKKDWFILLFFALSVILFVTPVAAQTVTVPDLTGLNIPEAAAALNAAGLALGVEEARPWDSLAPVEPDLIGGQSVAAGSAAEAGTVVDVTVLRTPNAAMIYDDNDITLVNLSGANLNVNDVTFNTVDGNSASFPASLWTDILRANQCLQLWSVGRNGPKGLDECRLIQTWRVTTNPAEHFWTGSGGTTQFSLSKAGEQVVTCDVANPGRCDFYLPTGVRGGENTEYVYFAYTSDQLAIINTAEDRWMDLNGLNVTNYFADPDGANVAVANPRIFGNPSIVADITRLAPGQCLLFTSGSPQSESPPQPCEVIARLNIGPELIFWGAAFEVDSVTDDRTHSCPAGAADRLILCVMPR
jgi:hypothetical protein